MSVKDAERPQINAKVDLPLLERKVFAYFKATAKLPN